MFLKTLTITISILFLSSTTLAQTTPEGQATALEKGDKAPFAGTLLDPAAVAKILADKKFAEEECKLNTNKEKDLLNAKCKRDTDYLKSELEIEKKKHNLIVSAQKEPKRRDRNFKRFGQRIKQYFVGSNRFSSRCRIINCNFLCSN
jgi:hypothetical protein